VQRQEITQPQANAVQPHTNGTAPRPGTVAAAGYKGPFSALDDSKELQMLFKMYPRLASQLEEINAATLPPTPGQENDAHSQYPNGGSKGFRRSGKEQPWNPDRGLENGVRALCRAREAYGKDGEGVREYSKLILQIVAGEEGIDTIRKEMEEENVRIISQLLNGET